MSKLYAPHEEMATLAACGVPCVANVFIRGDTYERERLERTLESVFSGVSIFAMAPPESSEAGLSSTHSWDTAVRDGVIKKLERLLARHEGGVVLSELPTSERSGTLEIGSGVDAYVVQATFGMAGPARDRGPCDTYVINEAGRVFKKDIAPEKHPRVLRGRSVEKGQVQHDRVLVGEVFQQLGASAQKAATCLDDDRLLLWCLRGETFLVLGSAPRTERSVRTVASYSRFFIPGAYASFTVPFTASLLRRELLIGLRQGLRICGATSGAIENLRPSSAHAFKTLGGRLYANVDALRAAVELIPYEYLAPEWFVVKLRKRSLASKTRARRTQAWRTRLSRLRVATFWLNITFEMLVLRLRTRVARARADERVKEARAIDLDRRGPEDVQAVLQWFDHEVQHMIVALTRFELLRSLVYAQLRVHYDVVVLRAHNEQEGAVLHQRQALVNVAKQVRAKPRAYQALSRGDADDFWSSLEPISDAFSYTRGYLDRFAVRRPDELMPNMPTIEEEFARFGRSVVELSHEAYDDGLDRRRREAEDAILALGAGPSVPADITGFWHRLLYRRLALLTSTIDELRLSLAEAHAIIRSIALRLGEHACERGVLESVDDVWHLSYEELLDMHGITELAEHRDRIQKRKGHASAFVRRSLPDEFYAINGEPPEEDARSPKLNSSRKLSGRGGGGGEVTGRVRVVGDGERPQLSEPRILVVDHLDLGFAQELPKVQAIVLAHGSELSDAAHLAAQYDIPLVAGINGCDKLLKNEDLLHVNGDTGEIFVRDWAPDREREQAA